MRADLIASAIVLGQPVDGALKQLRGAMLASVPLGIDGRIAQAKISRHVDDFDPLRKLGDLCMGGAVRQPAKDDIDIVPSDLVCGHELRQAEARQMRKHLCQRLPRVAFGDERRQGDVGVARGEPDEIGAGIAARAKYRGFDEFVFGHGGHNFSLPLS